MFHRGIYNLIITEIGKKQFFPTKNVGPTR